MPLVVVPTPIGNMEDITLRALRALREADLIACEDTRHTRKLLNHYDIHKPLLSYHRHNERLRTVEILERLAEDKIVALVSDAGTPGISDPGCILVNEAIDHGFEVDALPGANAPLPALLLSGLDTTAFTFAGFLTGSEKERRERLDELSKLATTLIFYVAPHSLADELDFFAEALGPRRAALVREISKVHQETIRDSLPGLAQLARERTLRGEMVLVIDGCRGRKSPERGDWEKLATAMKRRGIFDKDIANVLFEGYGISRNDVKTFLLREADDDDR